MESARGAKVSEELTLTAKQNATWNLFCGYAVVFAATASLITWLVLGETSAFSAYFEEHRAVSNTVRRPLIVPYLVLLIANPETEFGEMFLGTIAQFIQWLFVGCLVAILMVFIVHRRRLAD